MFAIFCDVCGSQNVVLVRETTEKFDLVFTDDPPDGYVLEDVGLVVEEYLKCTYCGAVFDPNEETIKSLCKKL